MNDIPDQVAAKLLNLRGTYDDRVTMERVYYGHDGSRSFLASADAITELVNNQDPRSTGLTPWGGFRDLPR